MRNRSVVFGISIMTACMLLFACDDSSTGPSGGSAYKTVTLTHWGFDFSAAKNDTTNGGENNDGETIGWRDIGTWTDGGIWFRTHVYPSRTQSLGNIDITSISTIDTTAGAWDTEPPALSKNDVVIAQCNDGFVKFKVVADVDTSQANQGWSIEVRYLYSPTPSFAE